VRSRAASLCYALSLTALSACGGDDAQGQDATRIDTEPLLETEGIRWFPVLREGETVQREGVVAKAGDLSRALFTKEGVLLELSAERGTASEAVILAHWTGDSGVQPLLTSRELPHPGPLCPPDRRCDDVNRPGPRLGVWKALVFDGAPAFVGAAEWTQELGGTRLVLGPNDSMLTVYQVPRPGGVNPVLGLGPGPKLIGSAVYYGEKHEAILTLREGLIYQDESGAWLAAGGAPNPTALTPEDRSARFASTSFGDELVLQSEGLDGYLLVSGTTGSLGSELPSDERGGAKATSWDVSPDGRIAVRTRRGFFIAEKGARLTTAKKLEIDNIEDSRFVGSNLLYWGSPRETGDSVSSGPGLYLLDRDGKSTLVGTQDQLGSVEIMASTFGRAFVRVKPKKSRRSRNEASPKVPPHLPAGYYVLDGLDASAK